MVNDKSAGQMSIRRPAPPSLSLGAPRGLVIPGHSLPPDCTQSQVRTAREVGIIGQQSIRENGDALMDERYKLKTYKTALHVRTR